MNLKDRLAGLRKERGYTLKQLRDCIEERTGERMSISYLSELERTDASPPLETLVRVARGYGMSLQDLLSPLDLYGPASDAQYPPGLRELRERYDVDPEMVATLSRIDWRGKRPETRDEWLAIYSVLKALLEPKLEG